MVRSIIYADLGVMCVEMGQDEEAGRYFLRALEGEQLGWAGYLKVGVGLARMGLLTQAMETLGRSIISVNR
jgi:hypothetical protein